MLKSSAQSLLGIVDDILDVSTIEAGKFGLDPSEFALKSCVAEAMQTIASRAQEKHLSLHCEIASGVPARVTGDPLRLRQVIINLLGNAVKFTEKGAVSVRTELKSCDEREVRLHFSVSDTGIGVPSEKQKMIFALSQADGSASRNFGGTGLGLAICSRLVNIMGGEIWVESEVGRGTTFHFTACFGRAKSSEAAGSGSEPDSQVLPVHTSHAGCGEGAAFQPLRILLAEDNFVNQRLARRLLEKRGHSVTVAGNGEEVLAQLDKETFDLVLMDVQMPQMDGVETTQAIRIREQERGGHLPIVAITAHAMKGDREKYVAAGMDAYLPKPIRQQDLVSLVESIQGVSEQFVPATVNGSPPVSVDRVAVPKAVSRPATLDREATLEKLGGDVNLLDELTSLFLRDVDSMLDRLREAAACGDASELGRAAHRLKGAIGNFVAGEAYQAALDVEHYARQGLLSSAVEACERLEGPMARLRFSLVALLGLPAAER